MKIHRIEIHHVTSYVSQVEAVTRILIEYFEQDNISEELLQSFIVIRDNLNVLMKYLVKKSYQELESEDIQAVCKQGLMQWREAYEELLTLIDQVLQTESLSQSNLEETRDLRKRLEIFLDIDITTFEKNWKYFYK